MKHFVKTYRFVLRTPDRYALDKMLYARGPRHPLVQANAKELLRFLSLFGFGCAFDTSHARFIIKRRRIRELAHEDARADCSVAARYRRASVLNTECGIALRHRGVYMRCPADAGHFLLVFMQRKVHLYDVSLFSTYLERI